MNQILAIFTMFCWYALAFCNRRCTVFRPLSYNQSNKNISQKAIILFMIIIIRFIIQIMQQIGNWYFGFGDSLKSSLSAEFCRENNFTFLQNPEPKELQQLTNKNIIIEGCDKLFEEVEKMKCELSVIQFGEKIENEKQQQILCEYSDIGRCIKVCKLQYNQFRRCMFPNLVFIYGPKKQEVQMAAKGLSCNIGYENCKLPANSNIIIGEFQKTKNYVVQGLFTNMQDIVILQKYFNIRVIHFSYERVDLPNYDAYFDEQYDILPFFKNKQCYIQVKGGECSIMDQACQKLCPSLIYINASQPQQMKYAQQYAKQTNGLILNIQCINNINKRKNIPIACTQKDKIKVLTHILYKDLNRKEVLLSGFPAKTDQFKMFEKLNRPFTYFVDLTNCDNYEFSHEYISPIYYLENQKRINPNTDNTLAEELCEKVSYWLVNGPGTCGKTAAAKYIASQFNLKLIEFQPYAASIKEKLVSPEDGGEEVPAKKYIAHFASLLRENKSITYVIDGLPYSGNDLEEWIKVVGGPTVLNLRVEENEQIKRTRKKAEGDLAAQISQQEQAKSKQNVQKNAEWIQKISECSPASKIYQVDYNIPQLLAQPLLNSVLKPRIFLVQKNNHSIYQNIAIKYDMGFVNLQTHPLRKCQNYVKKCGKRDIILSYYNREDDHLVSEDLYWIQKYLGDVRYLGIWQPQEKQVQEQKLQLQRPVVQQKPKPAQGEQGEEPKEEEEQGEGQKKKKFDIYQYQWSKPKSHKNLSQWFFKLKATISQRKNEPQEAYNKFKQVLQLINNDKSNVYEIIC